MKWWVARLREPSTWRGLVWLATVFGLALKPDQAEAIVTAGMAAAGLLGVFLSDEPKTVQIELPPIDLQGRSESADAAWGVGAVQPADELRLSAPRRPGPARTTERTTQPNPAGFGDRD